MSNLPLVVLYLDKCTWQYIPLFFFFSPHRFHSQQENSPDFSSTLTALASCKDLTRAAGGVQVTAADCPCSRWRLHLSLSHGFQGFLHDQGKELAVEGRLHSSGLPSSSHSEAV